MVFLWGGGALSAGQVNGTPRSGDQRYVSDPPIPVQEVTLRLPDGVAQGPVVRMQSPASSQTTTLLSDGFEGNFPGSIWTLWHPSSGAANVDWGKSSYRKSSGSYSIWCAASGGGHTAPYNTYSWAIAGPFDLSSATSGTLSFDVWLSNETQEDFFMWMASFDGSNFSGLQTSDTTSGFSTVSQDLTDWGSAGNVTGHSQVWIAFVYQSNERNRYEGAYVDNVSLTADSGGGGGGNCGTYVLTEDNEDNNTTGHPDGDMGYCLYKDDPKHPIEVRFDINETNVTSAQLLLLAHDVDQYTNPDNPEVDKVYMNNTYLGDLTGANDEDSTTVFTVPPSALLIGRNWVTIQVDQYAGNTHKWCVNLKQAQLIINGGCTGQASCRSVTTNKSSYSPGETVAVTYEVDTSAASQEVRVESNLVNPNGSIVAGTERVYTTSGSSNDPKTVNLALPANAAAGTYKAEVFVFDKASGRLESSCHANFTVTGGGGGCTISCTATVPATATVNVPVQFSASATLSGCTGQPDYFWFPDTTTTATINQQNPTVTYDAPGTYTWQMVVTTADGGRCEKTGTITVTSGGGGGCTVSCTATVPATATVNVPVQFSASATLSGCTGQPDYFWFPDSNSTATINQQNPTVTYDAPGTYTWDMVVTTADGGRCEKTGTITVTSGGGGGGGGVPGVKNGWIPVVIHGTGANGSIWITDVGIFNTGTAVATVTITIYTTSGPIIKTVTINPWGQIVITDIVGWLVPGVNVTGPINITSTQTIVITTRVYNRFGTNVICLPNGTLGQALTMWTLQDAIQTGQLAILPNLIQTSGFRTNIGFTNISSTTAIVQVELFNSAGTRVAIKNITIAPHQWVQVNKPFVTWAGTSNVPGGSARIKVTNGSGVVTYGSVIDNITNDPTTIRMIKYK